MTVHFIGAGPGAPDLLTLRGRDLIAACPVCLYAGSLVPKEILAHCPPGARIVNTAPMSLDEIMAEISAAHAEGKDVARLHSGDLSVWSAMGEQLRRLRSLGIRYTVTPGVPSFAAAAAALEAELTLPGLAQSVVLTRTSGRASTMPPGEDLKAYAATGATLAIHLSIHVLDKVVSQLVLPVAPENSEFQTPCVFGIGGGCTTWTTAERVRVTGRADGPVGLATMPFALITQLIVVKLSVPHQTTLPPS